MRWSLLQGLPSPWKGDVSAAKGLRWFVVGSSPCVMRVWRLAELLCMVVEGWRLQSRRSFCSAAKEESRPQPQTKPKRALEAVKYMLLGVVFAKGALDSLETYANWRKTQGDCSSLWNEHGLEALAELQRQLNGGSNTPLRSHFLPSSSQGANNKLTLQWSSGATTMSPKHSTAWRYRPREQPPPTEQPQQPEHQTQNWFDALLRYHFLVWEAETRLQVPIAIKKEQSDKRAERAEQAQESLLVVEGRTHKGSWVVDPKHGAWVQTQGKDAVCIPLVRPSPIAQQQ
ncbi:hypothetical protein QOT17_008832 [Balamuthia mandrillaris]